MNIIIISSTYRRAIHIWKKLQKIPKIWVSTTKYPLTLTLFNGIKFTFVVETENQRGLRGNEIEIYYDE